MNGLRRQRGVTLIELLVAVVLSSILLMGFARLYRTALNADQALQTRRLLMQDARFAMNRMVRAAHHADRLILPLANASRTDLNEALRQQTFPESAAQTDSSRDTAVLAVAAPADQDLDLNGIPDIDNDGDGRLNEDWGSDITADSANGLRGFDDDGDGRVDETAFGVTTDDDEYLIINGEDPVNGRDDDGDGSVDEDSTSDMNGDRAPGIEGVDDDGDGAIDEGDDDDDDEDGRVDEDWLDPLVFFVRDDALFEQRPAPFDTNADGVVDGQDVVTEMILSGITLVRFERFGGVIPLVEIQLNAARGEQRVELVTRVRVGGAM